MVPSRSYLTSRNRRFCFALCVEEIEIEIAGRDFVITKRKESFVSNQEVGDSFFVNISELNDFLQVVHILDKVRTYPDSHDYAESIFFCDFWYTIHTMECRICSDTTETFCYDLEISIYDFGSNVFFIFVEAVFVFVGIIADTVELVRGGFHFSRSVDIAPPAYIEYEDSEEDAIFYESIFEHCMRRKE